jgi:hypothetical protein
MSDAPETNGAGKKIRLITEPGAFGKPGYTVIVRRFENHKRKKINVDSYVVVAGDDEQQLAEIEKLKAQVITDPLFAAFTILKFVSETRPLQESEDEGPKIIRPSFRDVRRHGRSKYNPDGTRNDSHG